MKTVSIKHRKVVVVGAGAVGSTFAYALAQSGLAEEIALIDQNETLVKGQVLDLLQGQPFFPTVNIHSGHAEDYDDARVVVMTAGRGQRPGETRLQLLRNNAGIIKEIAADLRNRKSPAVLLVVSNPVDVMTYAALKETGWERGRVIGSGTVLDSARLRHLLSIHCGVDVHNVHGYMLGEHGDTEFAAWSLTHVGGVQIDAYCPICSGCSDWRREKTRIEQEVRDSAYHIIDYKGGTSFAVGQALVRITGAVLRGENSVLTVSTLLDREFGLKQVCLSVPCIVSGRGVSRIIESPLTKEEGEALFKSAATLTQAVSEMEGNQTV
jgi:L-lactate dehydrogenase